MSKKGTVLRVMSGSSPEKLTEAVSLLPFKVEIKQILKDGKNYHCFFTLPDEHGKMTNEMLRGLSGR